MRAKRGRGLRGSLPIAVWAGVCGLAAVPQSAAGAVPVRSAPAPDLIPDDVVLEAQQARIGRVIIQVGDVFDEDDPGENRKVFRFVNGLHRTTRERVIRQDLLFSEGEPYSRRLLDESERILRTRTYLYDAEIVPVRYRDGLVDIEVRTRDVWTLSGGIGLSRAGGENETRIHLRDKNFMGTGKDLGVRRSSTVERTASEILYRDASLLGTRGRIEVSLSFNSDGDRHLLNLWRPFHALDARRSARLTLLREERIDQLFDRGRVIGRLGHKIEFYEAYWGFSTGLREGSVRRWQFGFTFERDRFALVDDGSLVDDGAAPAEPPPERTLPRPWVELEWLQDRFMEATDLDQIARTEDINLGTRVRARLGWSSTAFGGTDDLAIVFLEASSGLRPGKRMLLFSDYKLGARIGSEDLDTFGFSGRARLYWRNFGQHLFHVELQGDMVEDLDPERQLTIGGDSGLRGYPLRFEDGDRRLLFTIEQRFFTGRELFKLVNVGAAVFFDAGRAWFHGAAGDDDLGVLKDVGLGLRLSPSRSSGRTVLHLDVAFPLDGDDTIDSVQWLLTTRSSL